MLFRHCLFFVATVLFTFSVAIPSSLPQSVPVKASLNPSKANDALKTQYDIPQRKKDKKKINSAQTAGTDSESARNDAKRARTNKWANAKKTTYTKKPKASKAPHQGIQANKAADRNKVKAELRAAADRMKNTVNLPGPKDQFQLGTKTFSGKEVRKAVMNSHLNAAEPVGDGFPKPFYNRPYRAGPLKDKHPIPDNPPGLREYPLTQKGYTGQNNSGPVRVITSNEKGIDTFHGVLGHDKKRKGGLKGDHYLVTHIKAQREPTA